VGAILCGICVGLYKGAVLVQKSRGGGRKQYNIRDLERGLPGRGGVFPGRGNGGMSRTMATMPRHEMDHGHQPYYGA